MRTVNYNYYVLNEANNRIQVCRGSFINILGITKHRVIGVFQRFKKPNALVPIEIRGGNRKFESFKEKCDLVSDFIKKFKPVESHYIRAKSSRLYLDSNFNISKMWKLYNENVPINLKVKESYFRHIFVTQFNISFSVPSTDVCSSCLELDKKLKFEKDEGKKSELVKEKHFTKCKQSHFLNACKKKEIIFL